MILLALQCFFLSLSATLGWWTGKQLGLLAQAAMATFLFGDSHANATMP